MSLKALVSTGTKVWLDSIDPDLVYRDLQLGVTGATSNPVIIADLIKTGRFDANLESLIERGLDDEGIAWAMTDHLVSEAQYVFAPINQVTMGNDGYVSFELDPLIEDASRNLNHEQRVSAYVQLGLQWGEGYANRMIKVPATRAGIEALEELAAHGLHLNVTLIFSQRQYEAARNSVWRGAQRRKNVSRFKSVYSVFLSRIDVYTDQHVPELSPAARGQVAIVNAKRIWQDNQAFWQAHRLPLAQEIVFASTGVKRIDDADDKYVAALAGSDIQTNPPETIEAVEDLNKAYDRQIDLMPPQDVLDEIDARVDQAQLEQVLMAEGLEKFSKPQHALLKLIAQKRSQLAHTF